MLSITPVLLCTAVLYVASATPSLGLNEDGSTEIQQNSREPSQRDETNYTIFTNPAKNWYEAFAACRERGLDLASIETEEEYQKLYTQIYGMDKSFWVSATDHGQTGSFVWMSTGHKVRYHKWHRTSDVYQPDNAVYRGEMEHCVKLHELYDNQMNDNVCGVDLPYICDDRNNEHIKKLEDRMKVFTVFTGNKMNWFEALADCKAQGLRLATVESEKEHQDVVNTIKFDEPQIEVVFNYWLSGSDLGSTNGTYKWMSSGRRVNYTAWHTGPRDEQPDHQVIDGETEHCIVMTSSFDYKWNDRVCSSRNYYICDNQF